jgi:hypothetical protein
MPDDAAGMYRVFMGMAASPFLVVIDQFNIQSLRCGGGV